MSVRTAGQTALVEVFASVREWELLTGSDQDITINGGVAHAIYCDTAGDVIKGTTTKTGTAKTFPTLGVGMNEFELTSVTGTGTTLAGTTYAVAW